MDKEQAKVVELLANVAAKFILALVTCGVFVAVTIKLLRDPSWPVAAVEMFLTGTVYVVFKHYFPAKG